MGLIAKDKGGTDFQPIPEDLHLAVCYGIWDIGTQYQEKWDKTSHKVIIVWELPECRGEFERDGKKVDLPRAISKTYTLSLHEKAALRKDLESWRGKKFTEEELKGFDLKKLLGAPCQIQVLHNKIGDKIFTNIATITKAPSGTVLHPENPTTFFSFEDGGDIPQSTPKWIRERIMASEECHGYSDVRDGRPREEHYEDEVPF